MCKTHPTRSNINKCVSLRPSNTEVPKVEKNSKRDIKMGDFSLLDGTTFDLVTPPTCPSTENAFVKKMGEFQSEAEAMKVHRRKAVDKKFSKIRESLNREREHRLADLKASITRYCTCISYTAKSIAAVCAFR